MESYIHKKAMETWEFLVIYFFLEYLINKAKTSKAIAISQNEPKKVWGEKHKYSTLVQDCPEYKFSQSKVSAIWEYW